MERIVEVNASYDFDIYLYRDGTYVNVKVITELYETKKRAHQPSRRGMNEEEYTTRMNVSKKPKLTSKGANPKVTQRYKQADPTTSFPDPSQGGYNQANSMRCVS
jgi:hypothetical protein